MSGQEWLIQLVEVVAIEDSLDDTSLTEAVASITLLDNLFAILLGTDRQSGIVEAEAFLIVEMICSLEAE